VPPPIDFVIGFIAISYFLVIAAATKQHFRPGKYPAGMYVISALSLIGIITFMTYAFVRGFAYAAVPLILMLVAFVLFFWAILHSKKTELPLAFDEGAHVSGIITSGPWAYVRHPFYVSYTLFWSGCAIATMSQASALVSATLIVIYIYSAMKEEKTLRTGPHGDTYLTYRSSTGFCLPNFWSRN
tara:strand:- start:128 stop:682 length:555 start_codon:yes stop_codon:yes gene_type:complete